MTEEQERKDKRKCPNCDHPLGWHIWWYDSTTFNCVIPIEEAERIEGCDCSGDRMTNLSIADFVGIGWRYEK